MSYKSRALEYNLGDIDDSRHVRRFYGWPEKNREILWIQDFEWIYASGKRGLVPLSSQYDNFERRSFNFRTILIMVVNTAKSINLGYPQPQS
jgi:hypothetical protein